MKLLHYQELIKKYDKIYGPKLKKNKKDYIECMVNYDKQLFKKNMYEHRQIVKNLILDVINEFKEFKENKCCIILNGSLARATNTLYSDIDINYFYDNEIFEDMINIEERVNYILQTIMKYRGKDRIHSMVVYLPLIRNNQYEAFSINQYPIYFEDGIIYNKCRENAEKLMYETYNSTRNINDLIKYINKNDNELNINEWTNCFELIYDNQLYKEFTNKRKVYKGNKNMSYFISNVLKSINNDKNYIKTNSDKVKIKDLKYFYKMLVLYNVYNFLSIYFRLNNKIDIINLQKIEKENVGIPKEFYDSFYYYLNLIQKLQYLLDNSNIDLSFHSKNSISLQKVNSKYKEKFNSDNIINDLNNAKYELYKICTEALEREDKKYE